VGSGLRGAVPALAGRLWKGRVFALCARDGFVRLQCSLRHGPAAAGWVLGTGYPLKLGTGSWVVRERVGRVFLVGSAGPCRFGVGRMCNGLIGYSLERLRLWFKLRA
jgi:hypothetical protein